MGKKKNYVSSRIIKNKYGEVELITDYKFELATNDLKFGLHCTKKNDKKKKICNGAGPSGKGYLVPDTIYGLNITESAHQHDWSYQFGITRKDKERADKMFLDNIITLIEQKKNQWFWVKKLRYKRAKKYYYAVKHFGGSSFYKKDLCDFSLNDL